MCLVDREPEPLVVLPPHRRSDPPLLFIVLWFCDKAFVRASFERAGVGWAGAQLVCRNYKQTMLYAVRYIVDHYARRTSDLPVIRTGASRL